MAAVRLDEQSLRQIEQRFREKICSVCVDRNPDGSCDRLAEGSCALMEKIPLVVEAICQVDSHSIGPYIESIRRTVCEKCELRNVDGTCDFRLTDHCMLDIYLPLVVEVIEEYFGAKQTLRPRFL